VASRIHFYPRKRTKKQKEVVTEFKSYLFYASDVVLYYSVTELRGACCSGLSDFQHVVPRGDIFLGKWRNSFAGNSDGKMNVQSTWAVNYFKPFTHKNVNLCLWYVITVNTEALLHV
jgi:hypothetical protein